MSDAPIISVCNVHTSFGSQVVHDGVSFSIEPHKVVAIIGGSGTGKSVLLKEIIGLLRPTSGTVEVFGKDIWNISPRELNELKMRIGVLFQNGALFSALTVGQNVGVPFREQAGVQLEHIDALVRLKLSLSGLSPDVAHKMPSELSGGMKKRAALARSLALDPKLIFLDEPTSGLDPVGARAFDSLVRTLCDSLGLTVVMVTHDLDTLEGIVDEIVVLGKGKVIAQGSYKEVSAFDDEWVQTYFSSRAK